MISCHVARAKWLFRIILLFAEDCWVTLTSPLTGRHHQNQGIFTTWHFLTKTAFFSLHFTKQKQSCQFFYFYNCIQILKKCTENYLKNCVKNVTEEELGQWLEFLYFRLFSFTSHIRHGIGQAQRQGWYPTLFYSPLRPIGFYSINSAVCRPSDCIVGRPHAGSRFETGTGSLYTGCARY